MAREISLAAAVARFGVRVAGNGSWWDVAPRRADVRDPAGYRQATALWRKLARAGHTMISCRRGRALYRLAATVPPGALVDCGVWNGGSTALLAAGGRGRDVWAFDSFEGLPEPTARDGAESAGWGGELKGDPDRVRRAVRNAAGAGAAGALRIRKGWFDDTVPAARAEIGPIAVLHVDGDWHDSVLTVLDALYDEVVAGGAVVIDDYGYWPGARTATDGFRARRRIAEPLVRVDGSGVYWRKGG